MKQYWSEKLQATLIPMLILGLVVSTLHIFRISHHAYLTDSEIWGISSSKNFWQFTDDVAGTLAKPLFHALLSLFFLFSKTSADIFLNARVLAAANCVAVLLFTVYFCRKMTSSNFAALICGALIASNYHFLLWFPSVRADSFSCLPLLIGFFLILNAIFQNQSTLRLSTITLTQLVALLLTPKAVFLVLLQWVLILVFFKKQSRPILSRRPLIIFSIVISIIALLLFKFSKVGTNLNSTFDFFISSFYSKEAPYFALQSFYYVFRFIIEDFILVFVSLFALGAYLIARKKSALIYFVILGFIYAFFIFYSERLPFFISSLVPLLSFASTCLLFFTFKEYKSASLTQYTSPVLMAATLVLISWLYFINIKAFTSIENQFSNAKQIQTIDALEATVDKDFLIWDAIGILPTKNTLYAYLGTENTAFNSVAAEHVMSVRPAIILLVGRTLVYWPEAELWLAHYYTDIGNGIWVINERYNDPRTQPLFTTSKTLPENLITLFQFNTQY